MRSFFRKHGQTLVNLFLLLCIGKYTADRAANTIMDGWLHHRFDLVEITFFLRNVAMLMVIMIRKQHLSMQKNCWHQIVALIAFFSGMAFLDRPTGNPVLIRSGQVVVITAIILSMVTLLNLGRSIGILIAVREIKTGGLYRIIRHPMYFMDILWRVGMILTWPHLINLGVFVLSSGAYIYRAMLEERFLSSQPEYCEYMKRVKYRFIPGVF